MCECLPQAGRQTEEAERSQRQINVIQGPTSVLTYGVYVGEGEGKVALKAKLKSLFVCFDVMRNI